MEKRHYDDWIQEVMTSNKTVFGLTAAAAIVAGVAYQGGRSSETAEFKTVVECDGIVDNVHDDLELKGNFKMPAGMEIQMPDSTQHFLIEDSLLHLKTGQSLRLELADGGQFEIAQDYQPVQKYCDEVCRRARGVILTCYTTQGCNIDALQQAALTLSKYPQGTSM